MFDKVFTEYQLGPLTLPNRLVMAPLTRSRAGEGNVPTDLMAEYYAQRASAGLIIAEATQISPEGQGYQSTPGIHSRAQVHGWQRVTHAVHQLGGRIFLQLWHVGRISRTEFQPGNAAPLAPSAIRANAKTFLNGKLADVSEPRAIELHEIPQIVEQYAAATRNALEAGFDGVEIHSANGYLIDQFLRDKTNHRTDEYGGSIDNRTRFLREVMAAVVAEAGAERTGIRIAPVTSSNDIADSQPQELFNHVVDVLNDFKPVYLHVIEGETGQRAKSPEFDYAELRRRFHGTYMANNEYDLQLGMEALESGRADLICLGRPFIANPDLVERLRTGSPLNEVDKHTMYGGGAHGYTDYPSLEEAGLAER